MRLAVRNPLLRGALVLGPLVNFSYTGVIFTITVALRQHGTAPAVIGLAQAAIAVGGLAGAIAAPWLQRRLPLRRQLLLLNVAGTVLFTVAAFVLPSPLVAVPVAAVILLAPAANAALSAMEARTTPEHMRGRVTSTVSPHRDEPHRPRAADRGPDRAGLLRRVGARRVRRRDGHRGGPGQSR